MQEVRPDGTILWLAKGLENIPPPEILELQTFGLEIRYCDDIRSYKKHFGFCRKMVSPTKGSCWCADCFRQDELCPLTLDGKPAYLDHNHSSVKAANATARLYEPIFDGK